MSTSRQAWLAGKLFGEKLRLLNKCPGYRHTQRCCYAIQLLLWLHKLSAWTAYHQDYTGDIRGALMVLGQEVWTQVHAVTICFKGYRPGHSALYLHSLMITSKKKKKSCPLTFVQVLPSWFWLTLQCVTVLRATAWKKKDTVIFWKMKVHTEHWLLTHLQFSTFFFDFVSFETLHFSSSVIIWVCYSFPNSCEYKAIKNVFCF